MLSSLPQVPQRPAPNWGGDAVQTFVPYTNNLDNAKALDYRRLGKQRVETLQILRALDPESPLRGWRSHPAVRMWAGYEGGLARYGLTMVWEWVRRGYVDTRCGPQLAAFAAAFPDPKLPPWWGDDRIHLSHRSNLIRKDAATYAPLFPDVPDNLPYYWPTEAT
jgi:hypothetical protein